MRDLHRGCASLSCVRPGLLLLHTNWPGHAVLRTDGPHRGQQIRGVIRQVYSHSMVPGGLDVTSRTTRFTSRTSLVMRVEIFSSTSYGTRVQSAVMASSDDTGRRTIGWP